LLSALVHFFEHGRWGSLIETAIEGQSLTEEDQLFILMQAGQYLAITRGMAAPETGICYERAEPLCYSLNRPRFLFMQLGGRYRYTLMTDKLTAAMEIAERLYSLAQEQNDATLRLGAYSALSGALFFLGDFESGRQYAMRGVQIWRLGDARSYVEEYHAPVVACLVYAALCEWHFGEIASCHALMDEAVSTAKELKYRYALAMALGWAAGLGYAERNRAEVERLASELIELSTRHNFAFWLAQGTIWRGWARSASGNTAEGIPCIVVVTPLHNYKEVRTYLEKEHPSANAAMQNHVSILNTRLAQIPRSPRSMIKQRSYLLSFVLLTICT
jgi:hypothetical protein